MKKHRKLILVVLIFLVLAGILISEYVGYTKGMHYVLAHKPSFAGKVIDISGSFAVVAVNEDEDVYKAYPVIYASMDAEVKDGRYYCSIGDEIAVFYDGNITDGEIAKVEKVYAITLMRPFYRQTEN